MLNERRRRIAANVTLAYPLLVVGALTGCWLLARHILGHAPVAWIDDPAATLSRGGVGWLYPVVTWLLIVPILPVFIASVFFNVAYILKRKSSAAQAGLRAFTAAGIWLWFWVWVYNDSHEVFKWWMD